jgi:transposase
MEYISGINRNQINILPESLDDYVGENNICRAIDAFVESLDFLTLGFKYAKLSATGRPPYNPAVLMKLFIYGLLNRIRSSRRLHAETLRNVEVMWLLNKQTPDDKTICNFRKDNAEVLPKVFRAFNKLCLKYDMFSRETISVDGTKIRANNNRRNIFTRENVNKDLAEIEKQLNLKVSVYLEELEKNDAADEASGTSKINESNVAQAIRELNAQKQELRDILTEMDRNSEDQFAENDPDSRLMVPGGDGRSFDARYNVQCAVDVKNSLIVDAVVTNDCNDMGRLKEMADRAKDVMEVDAINVLGDKGYYDGDDVATCENDNITCYVAKPRASGTNPEQLRYDKFIYDKESDTYTCPMKQALHLSHYDKVNSVPVPVYANAKACLECAVKGLCTGKKNWREIIRKPNQDVLDEVNRRTKENPELYNKRGRTVEHPFGTIKSIWGYRNFLCKGFEMVKAETALTCLTYNFRRVFNIFKKNEKSMMEMMAL